MRKQLGRMEAFDALLESLVTEPAPRREATRRTAEPPRPHRRRRPEPLPATPAPRPDPRRAAPVLHP